MTNHENLCPNDAEALREHLARVRDEFRTMRDILPPPKFRAEVARILGTLGRQLDIVITRQFAAPAVVAALENDLTAIRAEWGA
jgi:hypothetical protein